MDAPMDTDDVVRDWRGEIVPPGETPQEWELDPDKIAALKRLHEREQTTNKDWERAEGQVAIERLVSLLTDEPLRQLLRVLPYLDEPVRDDLTGSEYLQGMLEEALA
ncbi:MAG: hypothetical protein QM703_22860 [Gemmatales bacterium]